MCPAPPDVRGLVSELTWLLLFAFVCGIVLVAGSTLGIAQTPEATLTVRVDQPGATVPATLFGVFFEDINFGGDGGLYPERVKNRSFEFTDPLMGWTPFVRDGATVTVREDRPLNANNPHYARLNSGANGQGAGLSNEGFFGIGVEPRMTYTFSVYARSADTTPPGLAVEIMSEVGEPLTHTVLRGFASDWRRHEKTLRVSVRDPRARLKLSLVGPGALDLDVVSLFPKDTWNRRPNGLRADLVQKLKDLRPGFVRFPGGCIVEGRYLSTRYQWKTTIGDLAERRLIINRWNDEFKHRPAPDYFQSFGLGFFEYFQLCEDLGAEPLPVLNCGMACQFNSNELVPLDQLEPYIQDALDLIEFANGPASSAWGGRRAAMGHPAPFQMKLLGVGNEQWGPQYFERYERFAGVLQVRHPEIKLVSGAGPSPADDRFREAWSRLRELRADIVDEHCYAAPEWFFDSATRYDHYDRSGPRVFMGEYAAQSHEVAKPDNRNNWGCALAEAAFMTGLERNADVVVMSSYAPLFGHVEGWQWTPNLIWFDNLRSFGTPNYYVQQLFSVHRGTRLLPAALEGATTNGWGGLFTSASLDERSHEVILKLVNRLPTGRIVQVQLSGVSRLTSRARTWVLASDRLDAENSLEAPTRVAPRESKLATPNPRFACRLPAQSLTVIRAGYRER
jgi:alpha-N-arabinofuranosidase